MTIDPLIAPPAKAKTVLAAGLFGYTSLAVKNDRTELIDANRFIALYGEQAFEALRSRQR